MKRCFLYDIYNKLDKDKIINNSINAARWFGELHNIIKSNQATINYVPTILKIDFDYYNKNQKIKANYKLYCNDYLAYKINVDCVGFSINLLSNLHKTIFIDDKECGIFFYDDLTSLNDLIDFLNNNDMNWLIKSSLIYLGFQMIKPFKYGNELIASLVIDLYLLKNNCTMLPLMSLSKRLFENKKSLEMAIKKDYSEYINIILGVIADSCIDNCSLASEIKKMYDIAKNKINDLFAPTKRSGILSYLFSGVEYSAKSLAESLNVSTMQAGRYLDILKENNIIIDNGKRRDVLYTFPNIKKII